MEKPKINESDMVGIFATGILAAIGSMAVIAAVLYAFSSLVAAIVR